MTSALAQIPLAVGAGAAGLAGRAINWGVSHFLHSPIASTGLILISGLTLMAGTNAMFLQEGRHPAPLFASASNSATLETLQPIRPVVVEPETIPQRPTVDRTAAAPEPDPRPDELVAVAAEPAAPVSIGNQDIADMQEKLQALGLFDGVVDGYYGPRTADAIRAFEARAGLPKTGAATPQVVEAVRNAPLLSSEASVQPVAAEPAIDQIGPLIAQMQQEATSVPTEPMSVERATIADISPDLPAIVSVEPSGPAVLNAELVSDIQRGLTRLGFLQGSVNGVAGEATARAIRQFQIFNNYQPTGQVSATLRQMLVEAGAYL